jgi:hypothetical protein
MLRAQSTIKPLHFILSSHLLSTTSAHPCYKQCCSEGGSYYGVRRRWRKMLWSSRRAQPPVDYLWSLEPLFPGLSVNFDNLPFLTWYCFCIHFYVTICMKLDPGMHIVMHLVFFGKTGVTESPLQKCPQCNRQCKSPLPVLTGGPQDLAHSSRYMRHRLKASVSFNREKADARGNRCVSFRRDSGDAGSRNASLKLIS